MIFRILADIVFAIHLLLALFVTAGLLLVLLGGLLRWHWVINFWFRLAHLVTIFIIVLQAWTGVICPLTIWEMRLSALAGEATYQGAFVAHWLHKLLFYEVPDWIFITAYTLFLALVVASWILIPPQIPWSRQAKRAVSVQDKL